MKRILALIILTNLIGLQGNSQEKNFLVGGSLGFKYSNSTPEESAANTFAANSNTYRFSGSPIFGYFISNNINVGLAFDFRFQNTKYKDGEYDYIKQTDFIVSPFISFDNWCKIFTLKYLEIILN